MKSSKSNLIDFFSQYEEKMPEWLRNYEHGSAFSIDDFLASNTLYWTESDEIDTGKPIRVLNMAHAVHCFIYASCYYRQPWDRYDCERSEELKGYHVIDRVMLNPEELLLNWNFNYKPLLEPTCCNLFVYERRGWLDDAHGAERIALLEIGGDTVDIFGRLFCSRPACPAPFFVAVADYDGRTPFGYEYKANRIGKGGAPDGSRENCVKLPYDYVMERMIFQSGKFPRFLYGMGGRTSPWRTYKMIPNKFQPQLGELNRFYSGELYQRGQKNRTGSEFIKKENP